VDLAGDPGDYPAGLAPGFPHEYPAEPRGAEKSAAGYFDEPSPDLLHEYPGGFQARPEPGYPEDYQAEPGYPEEEDYPGEYRDYQRYPDELDPTEYGPPVRPYLEDAPGTDEPFTDGPPEPAKRRGRRRAGPSSDSFPYGPPPGGGGSQQREGYPRRH
jgi:hypothetical protein